MEYIYNNNLENVYKDILNADNLPLRYNTWQLYLKEKYDIDIKPIEELINDGKINNLTNNRKANFKNKLMSLGFTSCLVCGITNSKLLQGCHIHGHAESFNDDINNGIILCANCHKMFDEVKYFYIDKINDNYVIITKKEEDEKEFNKYHEKICDELNILPRIDRYLRYKKNEIGIN
jgi:predicted restriction endonuclease